MGTSQARRGKRTCQSRCESIDSETYCRKSGYVDADGRLDNLVVDDFRGSDDHRSNHNGVDGRSVRVVEDFVVAALHACPKVAVTASVGHRNKYGIWSSGVRTAAR